MIEFKESLPASLTNKLISEMKTYNGTTSEKMEKLLKRSKIWFASRIEVDPSLVDIELTTLTGSPNDKARDVHTHPTPTWTAAITSNRVVNSGTILLNGLSRDIIDNFYSDYDLIQRFRFGLPLNPDIEQFVSFSKISRHPSPLDIYINEFEIIQPDNGQIVVFDTAHSAPSLPKGTVRLLLAYGGN